MKSNSILNIWEYIYVWMYPYICLYIYAYAHLQWLLWEMGWWLLPVETHLVPHPCWDIRRSFGIRSFRLPNFACREKEMAIDSSILAWEIPWTEEPGGLQSMGHEESDMTKWLNNNSKLARHSCISGLLFVIFLDLARLASGCYSKLVPALYSSLSHFCPMFPLPSIPRCSYPWGLILHWSRNIFFSFLAVVVLCQAGAFWDLTSLPFSWSFQRCVCPFSQLAAMVS